jgi:drug/metabolite transporter (DMT)-like permease
MDAPYSRTKLGEGEARGRRSAARPEATFQRIAIPVAFVLCWSSGFVVPRAFAPYSEPLTFTAVRNAGAAVVLIVATVLLRRPWPRSLSDQIGLLWTGALLQGVFLAAIYWSIYHGLATGVAALIGGLQPAFTAMCAALMIGETITVRQWGGMALGFAGVLLVISPKLADAPDLSVGLSLLALFGVLCGAYASVYQKRFEEVGDLWSRTAVLFIGALFPPLIGAFALEHRSMDWSATLVAVYAWSVLALAVGATMTLLYLLQQGAASRAVSLIYLVPPTAALMAYAGFGEPIVPIQIAGFVVAAIGVWLVQRKRD